MKYDFHLKSGQVVTVETSAALADVRQVLMADGVLVLFLDDEITGIFDVDSVAGVVPHIEPPAGIPADYAFRTVKDADGDEWIEYIPDRWLLKRLECTRAKLEEDFGPLTS